MRGRQDRSLPAHRAARRRIGAPRSHPPPIRWHPKADGRRPRQDASGHSFGTEGPVESQMREWAQMPPGRSATAKADSPGLAGTRGTASRVLPWAGELRNPVSSAQRRRRGGPVRERRDLDRESAGIFPQHRRDRQVAVRRALCEISASSQPRSFPPAARNGSSENSPRPTSRAPSSARSAFPRRRPRRRASSRSARRRRSAGQRPRGASFATDSRSFVGAAQASGATTTASLERVAVARRRLETAQAHECGLGIGQEDTGAAGAARPQTDAHARPRLPVVGELDRRTARAKSAASQASEQVRRVRAAPAADPGTSCDRLRGRSSSVRTTGSGARPRAAAPRSDEIVDPDGSLPPWPADDRELDRAELAQLSAARGAPRERDLAPA